MYHYTDLEGYNRIKAGPSWYFKIHRPPPRDSDHPIAAYFTPLGPETLLKIGKRRLSPQISVPNSKLEFVFGFIDAGDLTPLRGGRGDRIFYSTIDYIVQRDRQLTSTSGDVQSLLERLIGGETL